LTKQKAVKKTLDDQVEAVNLVKLARVQKDKEMDKQILDKARQEIEFDKKQKE
jgi:hypothetical protein